MSESVHILVVGSLSDQQNVAVFNDKQTARRYRNEWEEYQNQRYDERGSDWLDKKLKNSAAGFQKVKDVVGWSDVWIDSKGVR